MSVLFPAMVSLRSCAWGVLVASLVGCATPKAVVERVVLPPPAPLALPPPADTTASVPEHPAPNPFRTGQYWTGSYVCLQGDSDLTLHVTRVDGSSIEAEFEFDVPSGPSGSFRMSGAFDTRTGVLKLRAGAWIAQPSGYEPVDLHGSVNDSGDAIEGKIDHPGCTTFSLSLETDDEEE